MLTQTLWETSVWVEFEPAITYIRMFGLCTVWPWETLKLKINGFEFDLKFVMHGF